MRIHRLIVALFVAGSLGTSTTAIAASTFSSVTVFGDSLVDAGNVYVATGGAIPSASQGYFQGRFTNGYVYPDLLSLDLFGTPTTPSLLGGTNFAFGGARAAGTSETPNLNQQLALYETSGQHIDPTGLYILNFGGNDVRALVSGGVPSGYTSAQDFLQQTASTYAGGVQALSAIGARNILITGFPVPDAYSAQADTYLAADLAGLHLAPGTNVYFYDYLNFYDRLISNPTAFGLPSDLNTTSNCQAAGALPACTGYLYFDNIHPTAAVQEAAYLDILRLLGLSSSAVPEPSSWAMLILGFALLGMAVRRPNSYRRSISILPVTSGDELVRLAQ